MLKGLRAFLLLVGIFSCLGLFGCREKTPEDKFIDAQNALNNLESYSATITYRVMDEGEEREYRFEQWVSMPSFFKIQLLAPEGGTVRSIISNGRDILIEHDGMGDRLKFETESLKQQRPLFIGDFLRYFWLAEEVKKRVEIYEGIEYVILTCPAPGIAGGNQELWLRSPRMLPHRMIDYDKDGNRVGLIQFEEFDEKWRPEEGFFDIES